MRFRLIFEGDLAPRQQVKVGHVHAIRQQLHPQIKKLWDLSPLGVLKAQWLKPYMGPDGYERIEDIGSKKFAPLISLHLAAELDIVLLRQQAPGQLIGDGGDIDNRLKTLFDALRMPSKAELSQIGTAADQDEEPLHCLLKDDALIHRVNVETDRLLKDGDPRHLMAIINVKVLVTVSTMKTLTLIAD